MVSDAVGGRPTQRTQLESEQEFKLAKPLHLDSQLQMANQLFGYIFFRAFLFALFVFACLRLPPDTHKDYNGRPIYGQSTRHAKHRRRANSSCTFLAAFERNPKLQVQHPLSGNQFVML